MDTLPGMNTTRLTEFADWEREPDSRWVDLVPSLPPERDDPDEERHNDRHRDRL